jgi:hypothetical protein
MHDFWRVQDPEKRQSEMINFNNPARKASALMPGDGQRDDVNSRCLQGISKIESPRIEY